MKLQRFVCADKYRQGKIALMHVEPISWQNAVVAKALPNVAAESHHPNILIIERQLLTCYVAETQSSLFLRHLSMCLFASLVGALQEPLTHRFSIVGKCSHCFHRIVPGCYFGFRWQAIRRLCISCAMDLHCSTLVISLLCDLCSIVNVSVFPLILRSFDTVSLISFHNSSIITNNFLALYLPSNGSFFIYASP